MLYNSDQRFLPPLLRFALPFEAGANQHVHSFLGGKGLGIQQGTSVWIRSPKSPFGRCCEHAPC